MPRFRKLLLIKCPKFYADECDHSCEAFVRVAPYCKGDCPSCPMSVRSRCPCVDLEKVEEYCQQAIDEHTLLAMRLIEPSTLVSPAAPPAELVEAIRQRGGLVFPLVVRPAQNDRRWEQYEVVVSQEVYYAARTAGLDRVPVIIKRHLSDEGALELMREAPLYLGVSNLEILQMFKGHNGAGRGEEVSFPTPQRRGESDHEQRAYVAG